MPSVIRWTPNGNRNLLGLSHDVDRLFESVFSSRNTPASDWVNTLSPAVDIEETPDEFVVRVDLPGISQSDVKVSLLDDVLTIRGERRTGQDPKSGNMHRTERRYGTFERSFSLGTGVRADQVKASYRDGVLEVHAPKAEAAKVREIEVQVAS